MDTTDTPLITIATVTYNAERTLERTLQSVAEQTYPHIEHLIVDGCSRDRTLEIVHRYVDANTGKEHPHDIRFVREPDKGLYDAMNKALEQAGGDYIVFLNAGDRLHAPDTLQQCFAPLAGTPGQRPAIIYGETDLTDMEGRFVRHRRLQAPKQLGWKSFRWGMLVCHQSFYVRTDLARQEPYNLAYRFSADYDWCIRLLKRAEQQGLEIRNSGLVLTDYLSEGLTTQNHRKSLCERFRIMARHFGCLTAVALHVWFVFRAILKK